MSEPVRSPAARYYTGPDVFEAEKRGLLSRTWQFACHSSALRNGGDYATFEIAGESLFAIKGNDDVIRTFYNVCQHRAHQLVSGSGTRRLLVCPYHSWTYELTGELRFGPNIGAVEGFDRSKVCLTEVRTEVFLGLVFVNLDPAASRLEEWFPGVQEQLRAWVPDWERLQPIQWIEIPESCNWKVSVENYSECYHCNLNHPTFSTGVVKAETYDMQPQGYCLLHMTECQNLEDMTTKSIGPVPTPRGTQAGFSGPCSVSRSIPGTSSTPITVRSTWIESWLGADGTRLTGRRAK